MSCPVTGPAFAQGQLLAGLPASGAAETFDALLDHPHVRIERIVSHGQASPAGFWYDQAGDEWVMLVQGGAELLIAADEAARRVHLRAGDWVFLPAHCRHRVQSTSPDAVWLALHLGAASGPELHGGPSLHSQTGCHTR